MLVKQAIVQLMKEFWCAVKCGVSILCTPKAKLQKKCQLRRSLYLQFLAAVVVLLFAGVAAAIFVKMPEVLLLSAAAACALVVYVGMIELQERRGNFAYIQAVCAGKEKVMNAPRKPVFRYSFSESSGGPFLFFLDRTEELGFTEGMHYLFAFRSDKDLPLGNESLLYYVPLSAGTPSGEPSETPKEEKARHDAALQKLRDMAQEEGEGQDKVIVFPQRKPGDNEEGI